MPINKVINRNFISPALGIRRLPSFLKDAFSKIGKGGMGEVYKIKGRVSQPYAIKFAADDCDVGLDYLKNEKKVLPKFEHNNIANLVAHGTYNGKDYIIIEYGKGKDLWERIDKNGPLRASDALDIVEGTLLALQAIHEAGYVHADVKPGNIVVDLQPGQSPKVKLVDFGIARKMGEKLPMEEDGAVSGSIAYLTAVRALTGSAPNKEEDYFALGLILYEMLSGKKALVLENLSFNSVIEAHKELGNKIIKLNVPEPIKQLLYKITGTLPSGIMNRYAGLTHGLLMMAIREVRSQLLERADSNPHLPIIQSYSA